MMSGGGRPYRLLILTPWLLWFLTVGHRWLSDVPNEPPDDHQCLSVRTK